MMLNGHYKQTFSDKNKHFQTESDIFRQKQTFSNKKKTFSASAKFYQRVHVPANESLFSLVPANSFFQYLKFLNIHGPVSVLPVKRATTTIKNNVKQLTQHIY